jgi:hypothetical protein
MIVLWFCRFVDILIFDLTRQANFDHADVHISTGLLFVAHTANGIIEIINGERCLHTSTISGCPEASGVLCAQQDNLIFAAARGAGKILVIDPLSQNLMREITSIGLKPNGLAWDARRRHLLKWFVESSTT